METKTNADRIRELQDKQIADIFGGSTDLCPPGRTLTKGGCIYEQTGDCEKCWLAWLQEPFDPKCKFRTPIESWVVKLKE